MRLIFCVLILISCKPKLTSDSEATATTENPRGFQVSGAGLCRFYTAGRFDETGSVIKEQSITCTKNEIECVISHVKWGLELSFYRKKLSALASGGEQTVVSQLYHGAITNILNNSFEVSQEDFFRDQKKYAENCRRTLKVNEPSEIETVSNRVVAIGKHPGCKFSQRQKQNARTQQFISMQSEISCRTGAVECVLSLGALPDGGYWTPQKLFLTKKEHFANGSGHNTFYSIAMARPDGLSVRGLEQVAIQSGLINVSNKYFDSCFSNNKP